jgi:hypothetical protein
MKIEFVSSAIQKTKLIFLNEKNHKYFFGLIFLLTFLWFVREFHKVQINSDFLGGLELFKFSLSISTIIIFSAMLFKKYFSHIFLVAILIFIIVISGIAPLVSIISLLLSSKLIGEVIFEKIKIKEKDILHTLVQLSLGLGIYATLIGAIVYFPINNKFLYSIFLSIPIFIFFKKTKIYFNKINLFMKEMNHFFVENFWSGFVFLTILFLYLVVSLLPDFGNDALAQHLFIPSYISAHKQWLFDFQSYIWACWPSSADWIFSILYVLGGETSVRLGNFCFLLVLLGFLLCLILRFISKDHALLGGIILLTTPLTYLEISTVFVEFIWTIFILCGILMALLFYEKKLTKYLYVAFVFFGIALSTKMVTMALFIPLFPVLFYYIYKNFLGEYKTIIFNSLLILLFFGIEPYLISFIKTGNPVFPLFNGIFRSKYLPAINFNIPLYQSHLDILSLRDVTFYSNRFIEGNPGAIGFVYFLFLPVTVAISLINQTKYSRLLLFISLCYVFLVFQMQSYLRYIYPIFPLIIFYMLQSLDSISQKMKSLYKIMIFFVWAFIFFGIPLFLSCTQSYRVFNTQAFLSATGMDIFIRKHSPVRAAVMDINNDFSQDTRVAFFSVPFAAGLKGHAIYANWYNNDFIFLIYGVKTKDDMIKILESYHIDIIILDENFNPGGAWPQIVPILKELTAPGKDYGQGISIRIFNKKLID